MSLIQILVCLVGGYLLGSISFGLIATRLGGAEDPRKVGSGNIGATNVLRTGRKDLALITLLGDGGKGAFAVAAARALFGEDAGLLAGGAAFVGHIFPFWLKFKGGKGVATFFGVALVAFWPAGLLAAAAWILAALTTRVSSLGALAAALAAPLAVLVLHEAPPFLILFLVMTALIYYRHEANIRRLLKGEEPRMGSRKAA